MPWLIGTKVAATIVIDRKHQRTEHVTQDSHPVSWSTRPVCKPPVQATTPGPRSG